MIECRISFGRFLAYGNDRSEKILKLEIWNTRKDVCDCIRTVIACVNTGKMVKELIESVKPFLVYEFNISNRNFRSFNNKTKFIIIFISQILLHFYISLFYFNNLPIDLIFDINFILFFTLLPIGIFLKHFSYYFFLFLSTQSTCRSISG